MHPVPMLLSRILAAAALAVLAACGKAEAPAADAGGGKPVGAAAVPVAVALAERRAVPITLDAVGNVEPLATVAVKSRVDGQITQVLVSDGQDVARDQKLVQIDARPFQIQLQQAQANLARDQAAVATAGAQEKRYRELLEQHYVSPENYADVKGKLDTAVAAVSTDQAAIDDARLQLDYASIRAPIGGRLGKIAIQRGNLVKANDTNPIVTINQVNPIYVSFSVPEHFLAAIRTARGRGPLAVAAQRPDAAPGTEALTGQLTFIDNAVDPTTGTIRLRATHANAKGALWPGQFVNVSLNLGDEAGALVVPPEAVQTGPKGTFVYVIGADSTAAVREVQVARTTADAAVIGQGLEAGEHVVVDGASRLSAGAKVTVKGAGSTRDVAATPPG